MSNKKLYKQKDFLYQAYHIEKLSMFQIADICKVSSVTIFNWLRKYKLETRSYREAQEYRRHNKIYHNKDFLYQAYHIEKLSIPQIADICEVSSGAISHWFKKYNIKTRTRSEVEKLKHPDKLYYNKDFLYQAHHVEKLCMNQIADICGTTYKTIKYWLKKYSIEIRVISEAWRIKYTDTLYNKDFLYQAYCIKKLSIEDISKICESDYETVRRHLIKNNIKPRKKSIATKIGILKSKKTLLNHISDITNLDKKDIPLSFTEYQQQKLQMKYAAEGIIDKPVVNLKKGV